MIRVVQLSAVGLFLSGCGLVGPDYEPPIYDAPSRFVAGKTTSLQNAAQQQWWLGLHDKQLTALLTRGAAQNLSIQAALARMREAETGLRRVGLNEQLSGSIVGEAQRGEVNNVIDTRTRSTFNAAYVFDLFGGVRRGQENAAATFEAAQFDVGTVRLAYLSDIVSTYIQARQFQEAAEITRQNIRSRRLTLSLVQQRRDEAEATELELSQAKALLRSSEADLPAQVTGFEANVFALATLLAEPAMPLLAKLRQGAFQPIPRGFGDSGIPADLLRNRPDVRRAERTLAAATAAVGIAEAQLYPQLSLTGLVTLGSDDSWEFGPTLAYPVLNRGLLRANRDAAIEVAKQREIEWRQTVLSAIEEVQAALSRCIHLNRQVKLQRAVVDEAKRTLFLSRRLYELNEITLTDVLDAQRSVQLEQLELSANIRDFSLAWSQLQVAAGKGWLAESLALPETYQQAADAAAVAAAE